MKAIRSMKAMRGMAVGSAEHWSTRGICRSDPAAWTDVQCNGTALALANKRALLACRRCPVVDDCRAYGESLHHLDRRGQIIGGVLYGSLGKPTSATQLQTWMTRPSIEASEPTKPKQPRANRPGCGTAAAYKRHRRRKEEACAACLAAHAAEGVAYRQREAARAAIR